MSETLNTEIIIIGGGIAGLWLINILRQQGYDAVLIEKDTLGGVQTLASQGMIHGGQKYTLSGQKSDNAINIAEMPQIWADCFAGTGDIDLSQVSFLSDTQIMWSTPNLVANVGVFAAAKAVNTQTKKLDKTALPSALQQNCGQAYELPECVMATKALVTGLTQPYQDYIYQAEIADITYAKNDDTPQVTSLTLTDGTKLQAKHFIFTAGAGNEEIMKHLSPNSQQTQRRPLKQVMAQGGLTQSIFGHCITANPKPRVTLTSHPHPDMDKTGEYIWYMGGNIAEFGATHTDEDTLKFAKSEMAGIFPHINWDQVQWAIWAGDRAEPYDEKGHLPPGAHIKTYGTERSQTIIAWPTKLTFAPALARQVLKTLPEPQNRGGQTQPWPLQQAKIGTYPWETAKWTELNS